MLYPTVTTKEFLIRLPEESTATHLTVVLPILKTEVDVLSHSTGRDLLRLSIALTLNGTLRDSLESTYKSPFVMILDGTVLGCSDAKTQFTLVVKTIDAKIKNPINSFSDI